MMLKKACLILWIPFLLCPFNGCDRLKFRKTGPSVIFFMVDSLRADALGCYGSPYITSPYIDSLSKKGIRFLNTYCHSTHTKLSIATLFSGLLPPSNGIRSVGASELGLGKLPSGIITIAEAFKRGGYNTFAFSTNPYLVEAQGFTQGFDEFHYMGGGNPKSVTAEKLNKTALERLSSAKRPFFAYFHYMDVHVPYLPPASYRKYFTVGLKEAIPYTRIGPYISQKNDERISYTRALYHATIRYWDDQLKKFMTDMEKNGMNKNLLVVITADHGEEFYEHGGFGHNFALYEETLRIPLFFVWPESIPGGLERQDMARIIDIYPTLANLAHLDVSDLPLQGRDLFEKGFKADKSVPSGKESPILYAETFRIKVPRCILDKNKKLIYNMEKDSYEYYLLDQDPKERTNIYNPRDPEIKKLADAMDKIMNRPRMFEEDEEDSPGPIDEEKIRALKSLGYLE